MSLKKVISKDKVKEYMIVTLVSHAVGQAVFLPWNLFVMNFTPDQFLRGTLVSIPVAFMWNYAGIKVNLYCSYKVKSLVDNMVASRKNAKRHCQ